MKYFFPIHLDGGNRGCEAIAKGTSILLGNQASQNIGLCRDIALDTRLGVDKYVTLQETHTLSFAQKVLRSVEFKLKSNKQEKENVLYKYDYKSFLDQISKDDIMISTGGDMMCYTNNQVIYTNNYLHDKGIRTILWGCSMGPENLTPEKEDTLRKFSLVYARESLTYDFFKSLGLKNVCLFPDPAFILEPEPCALPSCFESSEVVGINLSNYVLGDFSLNTKFGAEVTNALDYILKETNLHILLIPHVLWDDQDDRIVAKAIYEQYKETKRFTILDSDKLNYCQIRNVIGQCKFFIGARTHAVISAYSMCVPTIALGYSIKSRGIAKDLGLSEQLVVDSKHIKYDGYILDVFKYLLENKQSISERLDQVIPEYKSLTYGIKGLERKL